MTRNDDDRTGPEATGPTDRQPAEGGRDEIEEQLAEQDSSPDPPVRAGSEGDDGRA